MNIEFVWNLWNLLKPTNEYVIVISGHKQVVLKLKMLTYSMLRWFKVVCKTKKSILPASCYRCQILGPRNNRESMVTPVEDITNSSPSEDTVNYIVVTKRKTFGVTDPVLEDRHSKLNYSRESKIHENKLNGETSFSCLV